MYKASVEIARKDFVNLNMYYLRRYIGATEVVLLLFLFAAGLILGLWAEQMFVLIMCGVTVALVLVALMFYYATTLAGYNAEFVKRAATKWDIAFNDQGIVIELHEKNGEQRHTEKRLYSEIDRVAVRRDRVYLYFGAALMYYIRYTDFTEGDFANLCEFLKEKLPDEKFKMKQKKRYK